MITKIVLEGDARHMIEDLGYTQSAAKYIYDVLDKEDFQWDPEVVKMRFTEVHVSEIDDYIEDYSPAWWDELLNGMYIVIEG